MSFWKTLKRLTGLRINTVVSDRNRQYWMRPASKASTLGAYILAAIAIVLHLF